MSSHRAEKHSARKAATQVSPSVTTSGQRRAERAPRRVASVASPSLIGGIALVVAAVGAATAGQAVSVGQDTKPTSSDQHGSYVATLSTASLAGRDATQVSRSAPRARVLKRSSAKDAAEQLAALRTDKLRTAAATAESYAEELASNVWVLPTTGFRVSTLFGEAGPYWESGYHTGIDLATAYGTPAVAVATATVVQTGWDGPYGNQVRLRLENGDEVWYNHLSSIDVVSGQSVLKGQQVGRVGDTGNSYGAHLHFEYRLASNLHDGVDPMPYFLEHGIVL